MPHAIAQENISSDTSKTHILLHSASFASTYQHHIGTADFDPNAAVHIHPISSYTDITYALHSGKTMVPIFTGDSAAQLRSAFFDALLQNDIYLSTLYAELNHLNPSQETREAPSYFIGSIWSTERLHQFENGSALQCYFDSKLSFIAAAQKEKRQSQTQRCLSCAPHDWETISAELDHIEAVGGCCFKRGKYELYIHRLAWENPLLESIGHFRTVTYAHVGEGSSADLDLDQYDHYYDQLFLVDREGQRIVGGYRLGPGQAILPRYGIHGLYTSSLYEIDHAMQDMLVQTLELGRSFIVPDYQRRALPLFLLWQGILQYVHRYPHFKYILGLVSISQMYSDVSRSLIASYLRMHHFDGQKAKYFSAKQAFEPNDTEAPLDIVLRYLNGELMHLDELIHEIEANQCRIPVLIRKYLDQNARFLGFNIDTTFSNAVDGLMLLELDQLPVRTLQLLER